MSDIFERGGSSPQDGTSAQGREWKLIEKLVLSMQDEQRRQRRWSIFFRLVTFAYLGILLLMFLSAMYADGMSGAHSSEREKHVALVRLSGMIVDGSDASANRVVSGLRRAFETELATDIILSINSPGGSPVQSGYIYREIQRLKEEYPDKQLLAVINDLGASGAYYVAAAADEIYVDPASIVGSIGVIMGGFGFTEAIDRLGVERRVLTAGDNKAMLDPFSPWEESQKAHAQQLLDQVHAQFVDAVITGRGDRLDRTQDHRLFSGLIWSGEDAVELGLADGFGSPGQVARDVLENDNVVDYTFEPHPLDRFMRGLGINIGQSIGRMLGLEQGGHLSFR